MPERPRQQFNIVLDASWLTHWDFKFRPWDPNEPDPPHETKVFVEPGGLLKLSGVRGYHAWLESNGVLDLNNCLFRSPHPLYVVPNKKGPNPLIMASGASKVVDSNFFNQAMLIATHVEGVLFVNGGSSKEGLMFTPGLISGLEPLGSPDPVPLFDADNQGQPRFAVSFTPRGDCQHNHTLFPGKCWWGIYPHHPVFRNVRGSNVRGSLSLGQLRAWCGSDVVSAPFTTLGTMFSLLEHGFLPSKEMCDIVHKFDRTGDGGSKMVGNAVVGGELGYRIMGGLEPAPGEANFRVRPFRNNSAHHVGIAVYCDAACGSPGDPITGARIWHAGTGVYAYDRGLYPTDQSNAQRGMPSIANMFIVDCNWFLFLAGVSGVSTAKYVGFGVSNMLLLAHSDSNPISSGGHDHHHYVAFERSREPYVAKGFTGWEAQSKDDINLAPHSYQCSGTGDRRSKRKGSFVPFVSQCVGSDVDTSSELCKRLGCHYTQSVPLSSWPGQSNETAVDGDVKCDVARELAYLAAMGYDLKMKYNSEEWLARYHITQEELLRYGTWILGADNYIYRVTYHSSQTGA